MSLGRLGLSWRRWVPLVAAPLLLIGGLLAVPGVSLAGNGNSVKQFAATITPGGTPGSWTETVTNCGGLPPCSKSSTINLGAVLITVPPSFSGLTIQQPVTTSSGANWNATYASGVIEAFANTGSDKLQSNQSVSITFSLGSNACALGGNSTFATTAWGSNSLPTSNQFTEVTPDPYVPGATDCMGPNGTDLTGSGFTGAVGVGFEDLGLSCSFSTQWQSYHLPDQFNIDGSGATSTSSSGKTFTFTFPDTSGFDSSWYQICYASTTKWTGYHETQTGTDGNTYYVGILSSCYDAATNSGVTGTPCVSQQYATLPPNPNIVISVLDPIDSWMH